MRLHLDDGTHRSAVHILLVLGACIKSALSQCSGTTIVYVATDSYQVFTSVNYPFGYGYNQDCVWRIEADNATDAIRMEITDAGIEFHADCVYDYGEVFDGYNTTADSMGKFCGSDNPSYVSSGNYLTVTFHSDYSLSSKGFKARYKSGTISSLTYKEEKQDQVNVLAILGASIGAIVFIVVVMTLVYTYIQAKKAKELRRRPHMRRGIGSIRVEPFGYGDDWNYLDGPAPPAYGEIYSSPMSPPPQYSEIDPNPNPTAPLPGRREFMAENEDSDRQITNNVERTSAGERSDTNANTHFIITSSLRGFVTQINNYTSRSRTQPQNSTENVTGRTMQTMNPASLHSRGNDAGTIASSTSVDIPNQTGSLPNAVAPLSTESTQGQPVVLNSSIDSSDRNVVASPHQAVGVNTESNTSRQNDIVVTSASQTEATQEVASTRINTEDREDTCSTVSEMSLPSTRSVTMISEPPAQEPTRVS